MQYYTYKFHSTYNKWQIT